MVTTYTLNILLVKKEVIIMKKKALSIILMASIITSMFSGCSGDGTESPSSVGSTAGGGSETSKVQPTTITMLNRVNPEIVFDDNPMLEEITKLTGVTLEIDAPPISSYSDRLQILMGSGDLPDIVYTWGIDSNYEKWAKDGLLKPLDDYIENYPNLMTNVTTDMWNLARTGEDQQIFCVPRPHNEARWGVVANQDWLEKIGTTMPTNTAELYDYGQKVITTDPDGNGKDDTFLMSPYGLWADCWLIFSFLPFSVDHAPTYLPDPADGEYKVKEKMSGYIPYLEYMRTLYAEKMIDPEFFLNKYYDDRTKFQQSRTAMMHGQGGSVSEMVKDVSGAMEQYKFYPALIRGEDPKPLNERATATWGGWMINEEIDDEHLNSVLSFLDWGNSPEGFTVMAAGVEGVHYNSYDLDTRMLDKTQDQAKLAVTHLSGYMNIANAFDGAPISPSDTPEKTEYTMNEFKEFDSAVELVEVPVVKVPELGNWAAENPDIASKKTELETKFVVGEITLEELQDFLNTEYFPNVEESEKIYIAKMNEAMK